MYEFGTRIWARKGKAKSVKEKEGNKYVGKLKSFSAEPAHRLAENNFSHKHQHINTHRRARRQQIKNGQAEKLFRHAFTKKQRK